MHIRGTRHSRYNCNPVRDLELVKLQYSPFMIDKDTEGVDDMGTMVYVSGADHRATAERHFREAEDKMLVYFVGLKKGYTADVDGWKLTLKCDGDKQEIDLRTTCKWEVENYEELKMSVIRFEMNGIPKELIFSTSILFSPDKVLFMGMR